jgi:hypothetical protein
LGESQFSGLLGTDVADHDAIHSASVTGHGSSQNHRAGMPYVQLTQKSRSACNLAALGLGQVIDTMLFDAVATVSDIFFPR